MPFEIQVWVFIMCRPIKLPFDTLRDHYFGGNFGYLRKNSPGCYKIAF
uniref:Uncharacterized protein n=1 Tax=Nelumbo nucifera TaxID=4432 RepID=A0A822YSD2_NELNU|nr:TPA_asm: hypothetical protein HUJ06_006040 [Nelumbo nucifera]